TRALEPTSSSARRAIRLMVGPILPPAPSSTMSPPAAARASPTPGSGRDRRSSSSRSSCGTVVGIAVAGVRVVAVDTDRSSRRRGRMWVLGQEGPNAGAGAPSGRKAFLSACEVKGVRAEGQDVDGNGYHPCMAVTLKDVAQRAGVSVPTASRVLSGSSYPVVSEQRERVEEAAHELDYVPNAQAQGLLRGNTGTIGVLVGDVGDPYFSEIVNGIHERATAENLLVTICHTERDP